MAALLLICITLICEINLSFAKTITQRLTVRVKPSSQECFYFPEVTQGKVVTVDYEVTNAAGATGNLDITAKLLNPSGEVIREALKMKEGEFNLQASIEGDYQFCLDNSYSKLSSKDVGLEVLIADNNDDYYDDYMDLIDDEMRSIDEESMSKWDLTVEQTKKLLYRIRMSVRIISRYQAMVSYSYSQDLNMATHNQEKVTLWSLIHLSLLFAVGLTQVFMVKNLFSDKSLAHRLMAAANNRKKSNNSSNSSNRRPAVPETTFKIAF